MIISVSRKGVMGLHVCVCVCVGKGRGGKERVDCLLVFNLSAQEDTFYISTPSKFEIHNMPKDHQSCLIPSPRDPETIIQMFSIHRQLKAAPEELRELG